MISKEIKQTILLAWPLFLGLFMIMVGNGLQGTLLGLRAEVEQFPIFATGLIMSLYYTGFLIGCLFVPNMISKVGHIRVFAGLASVASSTILLHGLFPNPWIWCLIRVFSGISFAGLYIVAESWLNSISTNKLRGQIFGIYLLTLHSGTFLGQVLINVGSLETMGLFVLISVLVSLSLLPLTLADKPAPGYQEPDTLPLKTLIKYSPLSMVAVFIAGICGGTFISIGAVYANLQGYSVALTSTLLGSYVMGSALIPLAIGWLSDRMDRRKLIIALALFCAICTAVMNIKMLLFTLAFFFGGAITSLYSVGLAYMSDNIKPEQAVSASTSLILLNACGACIGPLLCGAVMDIFGAEAFFYSFSIASFMLFVYGLHRANVGKKIDVEEQGDYVPIPTRVSPEFVQITQDD